MEIQHNDGLLSYVLPGNLVKCVDKLLLHMCDSYIRVITIFTSIPSLLSHERVDAAKVKRIKAPN